MKKIVSEVIFIFAKNVAELYVMIVIRSGVDVRSVKWYTGVSKHSIVEDVEPK